MPYYKDTDGGVHFLDSADYENLLPAGCTQISDAEAAELVAPGPEPLDALRDRALELLPAWEKAERAAGIEHAGKRWLTTSAALQDIRDVLLAGAVPGEQWVTADRQIVPMTFTELQSLWQAITRVAPPSISAGWRWSSRLPGWIVSSWKLSGPAGHQRPAPPHDRTL